jgi:hypothetical protein
VGVLFSGTGARHCDARRLGSKIATAPTWLMKLLSFGQPASVPFWLATSPRLPFGRGLLIRLRRPLAYVSEHPLMANSDDPHAPYKLYDGDKLIGTYKTRAEARRKQQQLESQAGSEQHFFTI